MTIPIGHRQLVLTLVAPSRPRRAACLDLPAAVEATDAELVRLATHDAADVERARWQAMALLHGPRLP